MRVDFISPTPEFEPTIRRNTDAIFSDLPYIDQSEPDTISSYLEGIAEPLEVFNDLGIAIFFVSTKGIYKTAVGEIPNWVRGYYFIIQIGSLFQLTDDANGFNVHAFDPDCAEAVKNLILAARKEIKIRLWPDNEGVRRDLENNVPWCQECCLSDILK